MRSCLILVLVVMFSSSVFAHAARGVDQKEVDEAIKIFLSSQKTDSEDAQSVDSRVSDLDGDGKPELILLWALMGPTYSSNTLTVFSRTGAVYKPAASFPLLGIATKLASVKAEIIRVDQELFARKDPRCCPSIKRQMKYRWLGKKISEVKK